MKYDAFLSYANEDSNESDYIVNNLNKNGFNIWYAPISLEIGTKLLHSIEMGLNESSVGILLLSKSYISKHWTVFEFDTLMRLNIEYGKTLIPIWYNTNKKDIESLSVGLAGLVGIITANIDAKLINHLIKVLSKNAPTLGIIPIYENPKYRFLSGRGEIVLENPDGPATSLWELVLHLASEKYPIYISGELFSKEDILQYAANSIMHIPEVVDKYVSEKGRLRIIEILNNNDIFIP